MLGPRVTAQPICRQKATKSLPALKLEVTVRYVGHAFQTCRVF